MAKKKAAKKKTAKKASKKAAGKKASPGKKAGKKTAKKAGQKAPRKASSKGMGPTKVSTGKGATPAELGVALVNHCRAHGNDADLWKKHFNRNFTSTEANGERWTGVKAVKAKCDWWMSAHQIHGGSVEGPYVGATGFAVKFMMDVEVKETGQRMQFSEIGVYTVKGGKIIAEEFMYAGQG